MAVALERIGLQRPAYRMLEWAMTARAMPGYLLGRERRGADGLPLPPPLLRVQVTGSSSPEEFLAQGRRAAATVTGAVQKAGREMGQLQSVLDFGCGSGRVMRQWAALEGPVLHGSDYNPRLVEWCRQHLPFASFETNGLAPPLAYRDGQFDLVYALSVFTHLSEELQDAWVAELARVVRPGGLLLVTTRGDAWAWKLTDEERTQYETGSLVVRYGAVEGTNLCAAFHPESYVRERLAGPAFTWLASVAAGLEDGRQDVHVLERTGG